MKKLHVFLLTLFLIAPALAQERTFPPASQAEVNAGVIHNKFVAPDTLGGFANIGSNKVDKVNGTAIGLAAQGSFLGTIIGSNASLSGTASPFKIGGSSSDYGFYNTGSAFGQEEMVFNASGWKNYWNVGNGFPFITFMNGAFGDYPLRVWKMASDFPNHNPDPTHNLLNNFRDGNLGAQQSFYSPFIGGSAGSLTDLPSHDGKELKSAMPKPWLGLTTDDWTGTASDSNPGPLQTNYLYLTNMSYMFKTSGITAPLQAFGTQPVIVGDTDWEDTNRTSDGVIEFNQSLFPFGVSNELAIVHSHGAAFITHIYQTAFLPNQFPTSAGTSPDTAYRTSSGGHFKNSYPSGVGADSGYETNYTYPAMTPDTVAVDVLCLYTNGVDGVLSADTEEAGAEGYEHYRLASLADAILYPQTPTMGRAFWRNWNYNSVFPPEFFTNGSVLPHQMWFGEFVNHASTETPYYASYISPDQAMPIVSGVDPGLGYALNYAQEYENMGATNWPAGTFGIAATGFGGAADVRDGWTAANYTNWYSVVGEFNLCSLSGWKTNTWNHNQDGLVTNAAFLSTWSDVSPWPVPVFSDSYTSLSRGTNSLWIRKLSDGFAILAGNMGSLASNYNASMVMNGGLATNVVYCATNILSQTPFGSGFVTNKFIATVAADSCLWIKLTPALSFTTSDNATNQYHDVTLYTNGAYSGLLVGELVQTVPTGGSSDVDFGYTNGPAQTGFMRFQMNQPCTNFYTPFCVPLSPRATFRFTVINAGGATDAVTNTVFWVN